MGRTIATINVELRRKLTGVLRSACMWRTLNLQHVLSTRPVRGVSDAWCPMQLSSLLMLGFCLAGELVAQGTHTKFLAGHDAFMHGPPPAKPQSKL